MAERATTVAAAGGPSVGWAEAAAALAQGFSASLNLTLDEAPLTPGEWETARKLSAEKYADPAWNAKV